MAEFPRENISALLFARDREQLIIFASIFSIHGNLHRFKKSFLGLDLVNYISYEVIHFIQIIKYIPLAECYINGPTESAFWYP